MTEKLEKEEGSWEGLAISFPLLLLVAALGRGLSGLRAAARTSLNVCGASPDVWNLRYGLLASNQTLRNEAKG